MQPSSKHQSDEKFDRDDENNYRIQVGAIFPNWESLENALKIYELEVGFKNSKEHQSKKNINDVNYRKRESKKVECL
ncbi:9189_t:CDS:2 [Cetraspora pellucida]|uniref:9189_t:CDS:1 n=1 Tax=Cetraspora pellucida TaxID=1433469 RepID=A0A9N9HZY0_9GLOM|nr:9189_t:CDS:2 [Cetraspora pellucida]